MTHRPYDTGSAQAYADLGEQALATHETELVARYDPAGPDALRAEWEALKQQWSAP